MIMFIIILHYKLYVCTTITSTATTTNARAAAMSDRDILFPVLFSRPLDSDSCALFGHRLAQDRSAIPATHSCAGAPSCIARRPSQFSRGTDLMP